jgi:hypothetical protein
MNDKTLVNREALVAMVAFYSKSRGKFPGGMEKEWKNRAKGQPSWHQLQEEFLKSVDPTIVLDEPGFQLPVEQQELLTLIIALALHARKAPGEMKMKSLRFFSREDLPPVHSLIGLQSLLLSQKELYKLLREDESVLERFLKKFKGFMYWDY